MKMLKFLSRGNAMVFDLDSHEAGVRRFVGRRHDRELREFGLDEFGRKVFTGAWPSTGEAQEVPARGEYLLSCRGGDLWAADEATAQHCGVKFDPSFGGEHSSSESDK